MWNFKKGILLQLVTGSTYIIYIKHTSLGLVTTLDHFQLVSKQNFSATCSRNTCSFLVRLYFYRFHEANRT